MGPAGCKVLIHETVTKRLSWGFYAQPGFYAGPAMNHYRNYTVFSSSTRILRPCGTAEFHYSYIILPQVTAKDKVINAITKLKQELSAILTPSNSSQLEAITHIKNIFYQYKNLLTPTSNNTSSKNSTSKNCSQSNPPSTPRVASDSIL